MEESDVDENDENEILINLVENCPHIYDKSSKDFKNAVMKQRTWGSIAQKMNSDAKTVKAKWNSLRDRFVRAYREYSEKLPSGSTAIFKEISFKYFKIMMWLAPYIRKRRLVSSVKSAKSKETNSDPIIHNYLVEDGGMLSPFDDCSSISQPSIFDSNEEITSPPSNTPSLPLTDFNEETSPQPPSKKIKSGNLSRSGTIPKKYVLQEKIGNAVDEFSKALQKNSETKNPANSDETFMVSIGKDMQVLSVINKIRFKREVMMLLERYVIDNEA